VFALNRHLEDEMELRVELRGLGTNRRLEHALELFHTNMKAANTMEAPNTVAPAQNPNVRIEGDVLVARLKPGSWNVLVSVAEGR
jgi:alpha-N-arabinofuranosidase